jgi:enoyl-CoA hydratase/carnithine racemase
LAGMFTINDEGPVRWLTIDFPGRRNAIPVDGWLPLAALLTEFDRSAQRALVMTGSGDDFCSGADLGDGFLGSATSAGWHRMMLDLAEAARAVHTTSKPTVAAVDGVAVGAGMNLALCCDLIVASDRARFSEIFVKRGLMVDFAGTWLLPRRVGLARARELALTGRMLGAAEALEYGIINEMVPVGELRSRAAAIASDLAAGAPLALALTKAALERSFGMSFQEALELESHGQALCLSSEDAAEGVRAFLEKRSPRFEGR